MTSVPTICLIRASLPRYFPERYGVWESVDDAVGSLCGDLGVKFVGIAGVATNAAEARQALRSCEAEGADFVLLVHGGFTMGDVGREIAASRFRLGVMTVPEPVRTGDVQLNNFVSLNMTMSVARQVRDLRTHPVQWYHGDPQAGPVRQRLATTIRAIRAIKTLDVASIGVVGGLAPTFYNMEVSTNALRSRLGVEVASHDMHELLGRVSGIDPSRADAELARMRAAAEVRGVSDAQMVVTARVALALRDLAKDAGHDALAVSDWPVLQEALAMHPGAAFTWLEEVDALPCASEGDVLGAVTQLVAGSVTGKLGTLLDMTEPDFDSGRLLMWHGGGGPLHMADGDGAAWINHPMIGRGEPGGACYGAIADFVFQPGPVTVFRVGQEGEVLFEMTATIVAQDPSGFDGCRGWFEDFNVAGEFATLGDVVATVMTSGVEHHFVAIPGLHDDVLTEFAGWTGIETMRRRPTRDHLCAEDHARSGLAHD